MIINIILTSIIAYGIFIAFILPYKALEKDRMAKTKLWLYKLNRDHADRYKRFNKWKNNINNN